MRAILSALWLVATGVALAAVAFSAQAQDESAVLVNAAPVVGLGGYTISVSWEVALNNTTSAGDISDSAVFFDTAPHGPSPFNYALYPGRADGASADGTNFTANVTAPAGPSTLYLIVLANISGSAVYNATEWAAEVRPPPTVSLNGSATSALVLISRNWSLGEIISWAYAEPVTARVRWDTVSHVGDPLGTSNYSFEMASPDGLPGPFAFAGSFDFASRIYFVLGVTASNVTFFDATEYGFTVAPEPTVARDFATPWVFVGRNATVGWSAVWSYPASPVAELFWDTATHAPGNASAYPFAIAGAPVPATQYSFTANLTAPSTPATMRFILRVTVLGEDFYAVDLGGRIAEFAIEVRAEPVPDVVGTPPLAFVGREVPVAASAVWPYPGLLRVVVLYDTTAHGTPSIGWTGVATASAPLDLDGGAQGNFSIAAPSGPGAIFFVVRVTVGGSDFYSALEYSTPVADPPAVAAEVPPWALPGSLLVVRIDVSWNGTQALDLVDVRYDTLSRAPALRPTDYAFNSTPQSGTGRSFSFTLSAPASTGSLFVLARVRVAGYDFAPSAEAVVALPDPPRVRTPITLSPNTGVALYGQGVRVTWSVDFGQLASVATDFRWDTSSHAGPAFNYADYPNASALFTDNTTATFTVTFTAPDETTTVYGIVRVLLQGRNYYIAQEVVVIVLPPATLELVSYPATADVNQPIRIVWRVHFLGGFSLIGHTAIHWGLVSKASLPPSLTNYPGVGGPFRGNETNFFNATIPAQPSEGHVYFIVHVVVNGVHIYLPNEYNVSVVRSTATTGGGFLPGPDGVEAAAAIAVAALAAALGRGRGGRPRPR